LAGYYFKHRFSDDLDFFIDKDFDINEILQFLESIKKRLKIKGFTRQKLYDRQIFFLNYNDGFVLKLEFTKYFKSQFKPKIIDWIRIDNLKDIFLNKIACIFDRNDPKDYFDMYLLFKQKWISLDIFYKHFENKFGYKISNIVLAESFWKWKYMEIYKNNIETIDKIEFKEFFENMAKDLWKNIYSQ